MYVLPDPQIVTHACNIMAVPRIQHFSAYHTFAHKDHYLIPTIITGQAHSPGIPVKYFLFLLSSGVEL